ncbi:RHS repeat domain-containing protein, partial [Chitiniphilus shinanonensis]|uniref:RHS repeat domain-containing protein n=1 Tax=Chitiniphilus shinanonensis TaxID=553088 RepID=UPI00334192A0
CRRYDGNGNLTALNTGSIQRSQGFDANDNLTSETLVAYSRTLTLRHEYNANDAKSALVYPDNRRFDLIPDAFGRPTRLGDIVPTLQYNERSQLTYWQGANGRQDRTGYNVRGWPTSHQVRNNVTLPPVPVAPTAPTPPGNPPSAPGAAPAAPGYAEPGASYSADQACRALYDEPRNADFQDGRPDPTGRYNAARATWLTQYNACVPDWNGRGEVWRNGEAGCRVQYPEPRYRNYTTATRPQDAYNAALAVWRPKLNACLPPWQSQANGWNSYRQQYAAWSSQQQQYQTDLANYNQRVAQYNAAQTTYNQQLAQYQAALAAYNQAVAASQPVLDSVWTYDGSGNVLTITDGVDASYNRSFGYDGLDRLTVANAPNAWGNGAISYDGNGNLTAQQFGNWRIDYGYDATQKLKTVSGGKNYSLSYDGWGNVTSRGDGLSYQYDAASTLRWANKGTSSQIAYTYDGAGTRVLSLGNGVNRLEFTGADGLLYQEVNLATGATKDFIYHGRTKLADIEGSTTTWYHSDPAGSPMAGTDQNGVLAWRTNYRPYGEKMVGATDKNTQWFTGKPFEDKIGLSYYGARWYDPTLGRFMAVDPVDVASDDEESVLRSPNRYKYANNSPLRYIDSDGRQEVEVKSSSDIPSTQHAGSNLWSEVKPAEMMPSFTPSSLATPRGAATLKAAKSSKSTKSAISSLLAKARAARDSLASSLSPLKGKAPATVTAGFNVKTGEVVAKACGGGKCAEAHVVEALGGEKSNVQFTEAVRPRTGREVAVCANCEKSYGREAFPTGTTFQNDQ